MIELITSCLSQIVEVQFIPHMFVAIGLLAVVNIIKRMITLNF